MNQTAPPPCHPLALCPRCAYDLSGRLAGPRPAWPASIDCPECGSQVPSATAIALAQEHPRWSFEHSHRLSPRRWLTTSARCLLPRAFWDQMLAAPAIRASRWWLLALTWLAIFHAGITGILVGSRLIDDATWTGAGGSLAQFADDRWILRAVLSPYSKDLVIRTGPRSFWSNPVATFILPGLWLALFMPLLIWALGRCGFIRDRNHLPWTRCSLGAIPMIALWTLGIPALLAAGQLAHRFGSQTATLPFDWILLVWLLGGLGLIGAWWYAAIRSRTSPIRAICACAGATILSTATFMITAGMLSRLGFRF